MIQASTCWSRTPPNAAANGDIRALDTLRFASPRTAVSIRPANTVAPGQHLLFRGWTGPDGVLDDALPPTSFGRGETQRIIPGSGWATIADTLWLWRH